MKLLSKGVAVMEATRVGMGEKPCEVSFRNIYS